MKCPMSFANPDERGARSDCDPECAWRLTYTYDEGPAHVCAIAAMSAKGEAYLKAPLLKAKEAKNDAVS